MNIVQELIKNKLINPPNFIENNLSYTTVIGSQAYGMSNDDSDQDLYSFAVTQKEELFPHLYGHLYGFGPKKEIFETYSKHSIFYKEKEYDVSIHGIVKYFNLLLDNNPSQLETLFTPFNCVLYTNDVGKLVRDNRHIFLSKKCYHRYIGYAYGQLSLMSRKNVTGKRLALYEKYGYDTKAASHVVRLCYFGEQILQENDLETTRHSDHLKAIRKGEMTEAELRQWFTSREQSLKKLYDDSKIQYSPNEEAIKNLLLKCLECHYGSLEKCIVAQDKSEVALKEIRNILDKAGY